MKKTIVLSGMIFAFFTACRKDRTCSCTITTTVNATTVQGGQTITYNESKTTTQKNTVKKSTKSEANSTGCASYSTSGPLNFNETQTTGGTTQNFNYTGTQDAKVDCKLD